MTEKRRFARTLVTSALPYANGHIHLGHIAGAYLPADIFVRYKRVRGEKVLFIGGSDEYGVPITLTALKEGVTPKDVIDKYHAANAEAFASLGISYDLYGRTSWPLHTETVQAFFRNLYGRGYVDKHEMELWYSAQSDRFLPDRYVKGTCPKCGYEEATGDECENCGAQYSAHDLINPRANIPGDTSTPVLRNSAHWFLRLDLFIEPLRVWLDSHPEWRTNVKGIAYSWLNELRPRCITRDTDWGVPIPLDDPDTAGKRFYVWFDNAIGYVTNTRQWGIDTYGDADAWDPWWRSPDTRLLHFIGKDNVPFHAIMFPCYLMAQDGYVLADNVLGNEYLNVLNRETGKAEKGSKSKGNMISVRWFVSRFRPDVIRYYLCAIMPETRDAAFDWDEFVNRYNGELCDVVGNFVHRTLSMACKNFDDKVPTPGALDDEDKALLAFLPEQIDAIGEALDGFRFRLALERFIEMGRRANQYFDAKQPWATRKTDLERTATTLYVSCQVVRALCTTMAPFMPDGAKQLAAILGVTIPAGGPEGGEDGWEGAKQRLAAGSPLEKPTVLFPKLDKDEIAALAEQHARGEAF
ncbi:MAG TPA: methionine--tRNA ligase [Candidatus Hydrogenedentes bacterium]|nr:methionine--tRNA ligase [Candidatus Hydrogenedentota bacterium]HPG69047.1 methionine--tRNA ligase [Candidatus Hydrogenedentota bacterium]